MASLHPPFVSWHLPHHLAVSPSSTAFDVGALCGPGARAAPNAAAPEDVRRAAGAAPEDVVLRSSRSSRRWLDATTDHASTPPIPVPAAPSHGRHRDHDPYLGARPECWKNLSPFDESWKERRTSITFHPTVTLDTGLAKGLDEPLPRRRGRDSLLDLADQSRSSSIASRAQSDSDRCKYDPLTGELLAQNGHAAPLSTGARRTPTDEGTSSSLPVTVDRRALAAFANGRDPYRRERMASLTSTSSASPPSDDLRTPPVGLALSPASAMSLPPPAEPDAADLNRSWPRRLPFDQYRRVKSDMFERPTTAKARLTRRTSSARFPMSASPASAFLSTWGKAAASARPEPDDEGQEVGEYVLGKAIGAGGFALVREAYGVEGGERVKRAVKIVRRRPRNRSERENEQQQADLEREVSVWRCLHHRHILSLLLVYETPFATFCFSDLHRAGTLFDLVRRHRDGLAAPLAKRYGAQLASALRYLHEDMRIAHRDIKLENCLVELPDPDAAERGGNVLLCDFGMAEFLPGGLDDGSDDDDDDRDPASPFARRPRPADGRRRPRPADASHGFHGSLQYAAPEMLTQTGPATAGPRAYPAMDMWAFGVVLFALVVGDLPFRHTFLPRVQMMILKGEWDAHAVRYAAGMTSGAGDEGEYAVELLHGCLEMVPDRRWTAGQVLASAFLVDEAHEADGGLDRGWMI
ncbi:MAG: hypothetical protein M1826_000186 [Phylliscum demangeonii]|nr:MAG: hypothetical protein M1826_000186 [Phylliscum demangeonii]